MQKFGVLSDGAQPYYLYSSDSRKLFVPNGDLLTVDPYLYIYDENCEKCYLLDGDNNLMLADNWGTQNNACPYGTTPPPDPLPPDPAPTPAPVITSLVDNNPLVDITWSASTYADNYLVEISEDGGFSYYDIAYTSDLTYSDSSVSRGNESYYFYRITAINDAGSTVGTGVSIYIP